MIDLEHSRVLIAGFGIEGIAAYKYLRAQSIELPLGVFEERSAGAMGLAAELQQAIAKDTKTKWHSRAGDIDLASYDLLLKSPGIRPDHPLIAAASQHGLRITTQAEILFDRVEQSRIVGVTGTKGKSTTVTLLASMLRRSGLPVSLIGNIGVPVIPEIMTCGEKTTIVAELSSYQLSSVTQSPHIAVLLGIAPEHLDYHGGMEAYAAAKANLLRYQTAGNFCVFNADSPLSLAIGDNSPGRKLPMSIERPLAYGAWLHGDVLIVHLEEGNEWRVALAAIPGRELPGRFNFYNILAALAAANLAGATLDGALDALRNFKALPHRLRTVAEVNGVRYVDNSIATIPEATIAALETLGDNVQTLILGGFDRGVPYEGLADYVVRRTQVRNVALLPASGARIAPLVEAAAKQAGRALRIEQFDSMRAAVAFCRMWTGSGSICLLSPAAPSFGLFKNYEERGEAFRDEAIRAQE